MINGNGIVDGNQLRVTSIIIALVEVRLQVYQR